MKIVINPNTGAMEFDATPDEAVALMRLQQEVASAQEKQALREGVSTAAIDAGLTQALYLAWDYLVQHENVNGGVTVAAVARSLRITRAAASSRLHKLVSWGFAERVQRGRYRALCP